MIRRDYILRMIEEFLQTLARISSLKGGQRWQEARGALDDEFKRLLGVDAAAAAQLTETELLARLIKGEPTQTVPEKALMLTALFKEAGDLATTLDRMEEGQSLYLRGLHLLLDTLAQQEPVACPGFVPHVETFLSALRDTALGAQTQARLMRHYEQIGEFAKAEDCLFALIETSPVGPGLLEFGTVFYERLRSQSDESLALGNLSRAELEAGLAEFREKNRATNGASTDGPQV